MLRQEAGILLDDLQDLQVTVKDTTNSLLRRNIYGLLEQVAQLLFLNAKPIHSNLHKKRQPSPGQG